MDRTIRTINSVLALSIATVALPACVLARELPSVASSLPPQVRSMLNLRYRSWHIFLPSEVDETACSNDRRPHSIVQGDFDGDGQSDYAILLRHGNTDVALAFMRRGAGYRQVFIAEEGGGTLSITPRGTSYVSGPGNVHPGRRVTYKNDGVDVNLCGADTISYIFKNGLFVFIDSSG